MGRRKKREALTPDLTPLIDMVFLLLVFFIVSSTFKKDELSLLLSLPKTAEGSGEEKKIKQATIELNADEVAFNGQKTTMEELPNQLKVLEPTTMVTLRVDGDVKYQRLVKVLDNLQANKLDNVSLITEKEDKK